MKTALLVILVSGVAADRTFTVKNACSYTIWPAMFTDLNAAPNAPNYSTGWVAEPSTSVSFTVPGNWKSGRIWGRRNCDFTTNPGPNSCLDGGCNGGLQCDRHTGTGVPPATLCEFTLSEGNGTDNYDVSLVDGFNIPVRIDNNHGCPVASCPVDLNPNCPAPLKGPSDSKGVAVGCKSACLALGGSGNCCSGPQSTPSTCPSSGVAYYSYFKGNCPKAYAYAFDEPSGTALWACGRAADYTIKFCP